MWEMTLDIVYRQMVSLQNEFSNASSDFQLQNKNKNIVYKQMVSLQNEFSYESSDFQLVNRILNIINYVQANGFSPE